MGFQGNICSDRCVEGILHILQIPAGKKVPVLCRIGGLNGRRIQHFLCCHSTSAVRVKGYGKFIKGIRVCTAVFKGAAGHGDHGLVVAAVHRHAKTAQVYLAAFYNTAGHGEAAISINIYRTAVGTGRAILNDTAVQLKRAALLNKYCAAVIVGSATTDGATVHNESAAAANVHRTAVIAGFAIHDGTAVHNELTILDLCFRHTGFGNIHCTAVAVSIRAVHDAAALQGQRTAFDFNSAVFVLPVDLAAGAAILYCHASAAAHPNYILICPAATQGISIKIKSYSAPHIKFPSGLNVSA